MPNVKGTEPEADTGANTVETPWSKSTTLVPDVPAGLFADEAKQILAKSMLPRNRHWEAYGKHNRRAGCVVAPGGRHVDRLSGSLAVVGIRSRLSTALPALAFRGTKKLRRNRRS
jgi:hypothetical protein